MRITPYSNKAAMIELSENPVIRLTMRTNSVVIIIPSAGPISRRNLPIVIGSRKLVITPKKETKIR